MWHVAGGQHHNVGLRNGSRSSSCDCLRSGTLSSLEGGFKGRLSASLATVGGGPLHPKEAGATCTKQRMCLSISASHLNLAAIGQRQRLAIHCLHPSLVGNQPAGCEGPACVEKRMHSQGSCKESAMSGASGAAA